MAQIHRFRTGHRAPYQSVGVNRKPRLISREHMEPSLVGASVLADFHSSGVLGSHRVCLAV